MIISKAIQRIKAAKARKIKSAKSPILKKMIEKAAKEMEQDYSKLLNSKNVN